jgi:hypothetical protein
MNAAEFAGIRGSGDTAHKWTRRSAATTSGATPHPKLILSPVEMLPAVAAAVAATTHSLIHFHFHFVVPIFIHASWLTAIVTFLCPLMTHTEQRRVTSTSPRHLPPAEPPPALFLDTAHLAIVRHGLHWASFCVASLSWSAYCTSNLSLSV